MSRRKGKPRKINPHYWVFCEGETEESYVSFLRSEYRLPIEIVSKVSGHEINEHYIHSYKKGKPTHPKDRDFMVYDGDLPNVVEKLKTIKGVELILSNPSIELWFLLHFRDQTAVISTNDCIKELVKITGHRYRKGILVEALKKSLRENLKQAVQRGRKFRKDINPSTNMHQFIDTLEQAQKERR